MYKTREERYKFYRSRQWRQLRAKVIKDNNYECQMCKREGKVTVQDIKNKVYLEVDHILELDKHPELALDESNLMPLCHTCHDKKHGRFGRWQRKRKYWDDEKW